MKPVVKVPVISGSKTEDVFFVTVANKPELGNYLVAPNGMTLYYFTKDEPAKSNCYDTCAKTWPPFSVLKILKPGSAVADKFGVIKRDDGLKQVTYKGQPLYFWSKDKKVGDTTGQNFNKVWFVAQP
ncbi:MAG: hypothetical protein NTU97_03880 [Candidatus Magasanikbacteria bacterium]|nr:hypothetical protein [Candidatus Magasanikbacteria bacterium]